MGTALSPLLLLSFCRKTNSSHPNKVLLQSKESTGVSGFVGQKVCLHPSLMPASTTEKGVFSPLIKAGFPYLSGCLSPQTQPEGPCGTTHNFPITFSQFSQRLIFTHFPRLKDTDQLETCPCYEVLLLHIPGSAKWKEKFWGEHRRRCVLPPGRSWLGWAGPAVASQPEVICRQPQ